MTKHYLPNGLKKGNLGNTFNALAAVYALHCISYYAQNARNDFFDKSYWLNPDIVFNEDGELLENWFTKVPESDLFYHATKYREQGAQL